MLVLVLVSCTVGLGLSIPKPYRPDTPYGVVLFFVGDAWVGKEPGKRWDWEQWVCGNAVDRIRDVLDGEDRAITAEFGKAWDIEHHWDPNYQTSTHGHRATVVVQGELWIFKHGNTAVQDYSSYSATDKKWTFILKKSWGNWCINQITNQPRPTRN
jgi:hypothetical protein